MEGKVYHLTEAQVKLLDCVLPENYDEIKISGVEFEKYNEDGLNIRDKEQYEKFYAEENVAVIDSYDCVPKVVDLVDNDLK